jgi:ABC-2 type transport system permease protein
VTLLRAELLKLTTVRTTWTMLGIALAAETLFAGLFTALVNVEELDDFVELQTSIGLLMVMLLVLGVLAITTEFRHGTASTTFLASPRRYPAMVAKLGACLALGLGAGLVYVLLTGSLEIPIFDARTHALPATGHIVSVYVGMVMSFSLICAFGLGVGAIVRNQVGAIIAAFATFFILSSLPALLPGNIGDYFPGESIGSLQGHSEEGLSQVAGGIVFAGWTLGLWAIGTWLTMVRDLNE